MCGLEVTKVTICGKIGSKSHLNATEVTVYSDKKATHVKGHGDERPKPFPMHQSDCHNQRPKSFPSTSQTVTISDQSHFPSTSQTVTICEKSHSPLCAYSATTAIWCRVTLCSSHDRQYTAGMSLSSVLKSNVAFRPNRPSGLLRTGSPPRLLHSS